jgi:hypothetical protein
MHAAEKGFISWNKSRRGRKIRGKFLIKKVLTPAIVAMAD